MDSAEFHAAVSNTSKLGLLLFNRSLIRASVCLLGVPCRETDTTTKGYQLWYVNEH